MSPLWISLELRMWGSGNCKDVHSCKAPVKPSPPTHFLQATNNPTFTGRLPFLSLKQHWRECCTLWWLYSLRVTAIGNTDSSTLYIKTTEQQEYKFRHKAWHQCSLTHWPSQFIFIARSKHAAAILDCKQQTYEYSISDVSRMNLARVNVGVLTRPHCAYKRHSTVQHYIIFIYINHSQHDFSIKESKV